MQKFVGHSRYVDGCPEPDVFVIEMANDVDFGIKMVWQIIRRSTTWAIHPKGRLITAEYNTAT